MIEIVKMDPEQVGEKLTSLGFSEERLAKAAKLPIGEIPLNGTFADLDKDHFVTPDKVTHDFPIFIVTDEAGNKRGTIPVASILRQTCALDKSGKPEAFQIKETSSSPHKGKWGLKSTRLNSELICGSEIEVISNLLGKKFTLEIIKDLKCPLVQAGGKHFKATKKEAAEMYEIKPQSPKLLTLE